MQNQQVLGQGFYEASIGVPVGNAAAELIKTAEKSIKNAFDNLNGKMYEQNASLGNKASIKEEQQTPRPGRR